MTISTANPSTAQTGLNSEALFGTVIASIHLPVTEQTQGTRTAHRHAAWRDSRSVCCLADGERHLGHIVRAGRSWLAFDATRYNDTATGFRLVGICLNVAAAKSTVERVHQMNRPCPGTLQ
ncbi:MAG: hypothetical protein ABSB15_09160 [Bryobacteraceae bacterium]|jgi:hypothetical protein